MNNIHDQPIVSHAKHYNRLSRHYMTPEQIMSVRIPHSAEEHAIYATASALVSERHEKSDLVDMVYALLLKWEEEK